METLCGLGFTLRENCVFSRVENPLVGSLTFLISFPASCSDILSSGRGAQRWRRIADVMHMLSGRRGGLNLQRGWWRLHCACPKLNTNTNLLIPFDCKWQTWRSQSKEANCWLARSLLIWNRSNKRLTAKSHFLLSATLTIYSWSTEK